jgi:DNA-binding CsgD family transcriptional regulator
VRFSPQRDAGDIRRTPDARPPIKPARRQRSKVETCVAGGLSVLKTAAALGISQNTLRFYFSDDLQNGRARNFADVLVLFARAAKPGSVSAMNFLLNLFPGRAPMLRKKVNAKRDAETAGVGNDWVDDLRTLSDGKPQ